MKNCRVIPSILGFVLVLMIATTAAAAPKLTFKFTTVNVHGAIQTIPRGVNNAGVTVGQYEDNATLLHGYILDGKKLTKLDDPRALNGTTGANGVNPNGAISVVGVYTNSSRNQVGFLYKNAKYADIPGPKVALESSANSINDSGAIVGWYVDAGNVFHGFLLKGKKYTTLDVPGNVGSTTATSINNRGWIVLFWVSSKGLESSITKDSGKTYKTINVPDAAGSLASGIDAAGDVVYQWMDSSNNIHGALLQAGEYFKFNDSKGVSTIGNGINDKNVIVGGFETVIEGPVNGFKSTYK